MERQPPSSGNMMWEEQCDILDLPGSVQLHQRSTGMVQHVQQTEQLCPYFICNEIEIEIGDGFGAHDSVTNNEGNTEQNELGNSDDMVPWPRVKWTEKMVKTLITILSYVEEETSTQCWKKKVLLLRKIGKWRCISRVMMETGYKVSPQQCEDKFNSLNKTYRKLNDLLGRGTSCKVVENPELLGALNVSAKAKESAKKIMASKHLFFEEMCSYHNGNRLFLPHVPEVLQSLLSVLENKGTCAAQTSNQICDTEGGFNVLNDTTEANVATFELAEDSDAWIKELEVHEVADLGNPSTGNSSFQGQAQCMQANFGPAQPEMTRLGAASQFDVIYLDPEPAAENNAIERENQMMEARFHQLEEQKLELKAKKLKLQMQWLQVEETNLVENFELEKMRVENKRLKLANEYAELKLERKMKNSNRSSP